MDHHGESPETEPTRVKTTVLSTTVKQAVGEELVDHGLGDDEGKKVPLKQRVREGVTDLYYNVGNFVTDPRNAYKKYVNRQIQRLQQKFTSSYGPPYEDDYGGSLFVEINNTRASWLEVHNMLKRGADPNIGDPEDYNCTAMHFAARHLHLGIMKILKKAGGHMDAEDDLGMRPLGVLCAFERRYRDQEEVAFFEFLMEEGVDMHHQDKAGHTALDHAIISGKACIVPLLLKRGAKVFKSKEHLCLPRPLLATKNVMVREMIKARLEEESKAYLRRLAAADEAVRKARQLERKRLIRARRLQQQEEAIARQNELRSWQELESVEAERQQQLRLDRERREREAEQRRQALGMWEKQDRGWSFKKRDFKPTAVIEDLYVSAVETHEQIEHRRTYHGLEARWKEICGEDLGVPYPRKSNE